MPSMVRDPSSLRRGRPVTLPSSCASPTPAPASHRKTWASCSLRSSPPSPPGRGQASGWRSSMGSSRCTTARSTWRARSAAAPHSPLPCRFVRRMGGMVRRLQPTLLRETRVTMETKGRILVIDDEEGIRKGCIRVLQPLGYAIDTAASFHEGLKRIDADEFDVVLLDVLMPDGRGIDLLEPIRERDPEAVAILITGYASVELAVD